MATALTAVLVSSSACAQSNPLRGLWIGSAKLQAVNEVAVPLDAANTPVAPDPRVPTPTRDAADIRLIIHVNGAGQAFLLKDVAVLNRAAGGTGTAEADMALVTDPRLYPEFPPQPAIRVASAVFDFGDAQTTAAIDAIVEDAATRAAAFAATPSLAVSTPTERNAACAAAVAAMTPALDALAAKADVATAFNAFLDRVDAAALSAIAADTNAPVVATLSAEAEALRTGAFYGDTRANEMVQAIRAAAGAAAPDDRLAALNNAAASAADLENKYQRFISGKTFSDMVAAAAEAGATAATAAGATQAGVLEAMRTTQAASDAITAGLLAKVNRYADTRSTDAIDAVLDAMAAAAFANRALTGPAIISLAEAAGRAELADRVARHPLPTTAPTLDYNAFVDSSAYQGAVAIAADAAATAAIAERAANALYTATSLRDAAKIAAVEALRGVYVAAARARRTELPLAGAFAPGSGDSRLVADLAQPTDLGPAGLTGSLSLPADHPTNPFRHRRHPDHTTGYDIRREIRLDFDGATGAAAETAGYGVSRITGVYREEIFGLHKPLGPTPATAPIGLKTEGRFELNRISEIDALNAR
jgi:hypothetical protein